MRQICHAHREAATRAGYVQKAEVRTKIPFNTTARSKQHVRDLSLILGSNN